MNYANVLLQLSGLGKIRRMFNFQLLTITKHPTSSLNL